MDEAVPQDHSGEKNVKSVQQATDVPVPHGAEQNTEVPKTSDSDNTAPQTVEQASDVPVPQNLETLTESAISVEVAIVIPLEASTRDHSVAPSA